MYWLQSGYNAALLLREPLMQLVRGLYNLPPDPAPAAVTIGNFDGVHRGHQKILETLSVEANRRGLVSTVMLFEPQPTEYFSADQAPARLYRIREKLEQFRQQPLDRVLILRFDDALAQLSAERFIQDILINGLNVKYLLVGDDFRFGCKRQGDFSLLSQAADQYDFELENLDSVLHSEQRVSSTQIRDYLAAGNFKKAEQLLGRPYRMQGRVSYGDAIGRDLGYPTINLPVRRLKSPLRGIYAVRVYGIEGSSTLDGVASVGSRPTVDGKSCLLEVHLFDWSGKCYGQQLEVEFVKYLRNEEKFDDLDTLKQQIEKDAAWARKELQA